MRNMASVYITKTSDESLRRRLIEGLEFINWEDKVKPGSTVFIKPNLTWIEYTKGVTTSPTLVEHLIDILRVRAGRIIVGESDGGNHAFTADQAFVGHGLDKICESRAVELLNLSRLPAVSVEEEILDRRVSVVLPRLLLEEVDCFISVPVMKVHAMTGVSLSIKNLWGCYSDSMRCLHHKFLDHKLALIAKKLKPQIVVIDGKYALDGHGPMFGSAVRMDMLLCSDNVVAADAVGANIMGMHPSTHSHSTLGGILPTRLTHISVASRAGLGPIDHCDFTSNEDWKAYARTFSVRKTMMDRLCILTFNSEFLAEIVFKSKLTGPIFKLSDRLVRNETELNMVVACRSKSRTYQ